MNTLTQYKYESWMCTECGLRNPMVDPVCSECGECQPSVVRKSVQRQRVSNRGVGNQRAEQIQNNVSYNQVQMVIEPEAEEPAVELFRREESPMEKSLMIGANLVMWISAWIIALVALFITTIVILGLYKAFS